MDKQIEKTLTIIVPIYDQKRIMAEERKAMMLLVELGNGPPSIAQHIEQTAEPAAVEELYELIVASARAKDWGNFLERPGMKQQR
jgi:hypothetical protein